MARARKKRGPGLWLRFGVEVDPDPEEQGRWIAQMSDMPTIVAGGGDRDEALKNLSRVAERAILARWQTPPAVENRAEK